MPDDRNIRIELAEGATDIGLAVMLKYLLFQNLEEHPRKVADFNKLDIPIGLTVSDADLALTMKFEKGVLTIYPGIQGDPGLNITAEAVALP